MIADGDGGLTHVCPINECPDALKRHILMCRPHWRMVPKFMQRDVNGTWRAAVRLSKKSMVDSGRVQAVRDYLIARRTAIAFVNGRMSRD